MKSYNSWLLSGLLLLLPLVFRAQENGHANPWTFTNEPIYSSRQSETQILPARYLVARLDIVKLKALLAEAPDWQSESSRRNQLSMPFPLPNGSFAEFQIMEAPVMHPELAKKFPEIRTYVGYGLVDPSSYLRFSLTNQGLHAMVLSGSEGSVFIDPSGIENSSLNLIYYKQDWHEKADWSCHTEQELYRLPENQESQLRSTHCQLRTYRLALACTGEYARFHGGTVATTLAGMVTTLTRVNGVYERYAGITLQLVANNDKLVFTDPNLDPYNNNSGSSMLSQNQITCDNLIGNANYDIGHVFSTGGGGIAYMRNVCNSTNKAGGVTGRSNPSSDPFDIDYVCHEMGHQFGASHTQGNNCNRNYDTAVEPGSGSTIMSYAGICNPNIQSNSDAYFHAVSLAEIKTFVSANGNSCAQTGTNFAAPVAIAGPDFSIPRSTPFVLTGSLESGDTSKVLWNWEQMDMELTTMPPQASNTGGPSFRSFYPVRSPSRYLPNLNTIRNNSLSVWEVLPDVSRVLNFRLTVYDYAQAGACSSSDDMRINVVQSAGPFIVTSPNGSESWTPGTKQFVSWQVAGTASAPINCTHVDLLLSLDGGQSFPFTILEKTPNDGFEEIVVPAYASSQARIMVRASGNIFFDISNADFTLKSSPLLFVSAQAINPNCFGDNKGKATAIVSGGSGEYTYQWSNGAATQTVEGLTPGLYTVTVSSGTTKATASVNVGQPSPLLLSLEGHDALKGNDGWAKVNASGGSGGFSYTWSNGATTATVKNLVPGIYSVTVTDSNHCKASGSINLSGSSSLRMEYGTVSNVTNQWQTVRLQNNYQSLVVVASLVILDNTGPSIVTRIRNAGTNSFELRAQLAGDESAEISPMLVHFFAAEEGVYTMSKHGVNLEARKYNSVKTSQSKYWLYEPQSYGQTYNNPVVIGQVMTYNDPKWSVFWSSKDGERSNPPTSKSLSIGKHIAEDDTTPERSPEVIGYMVFEEGNGQINGKKFTCSVGHAIQRGLPANSSGFKYQTEGLTNIQAVVVASAAMNGQEGGWPVLRYSRPGMNAFKLYVAEDQSKTGERSHAEERVAYVAFGDGPYEQPAINAVRFGQAKQNTAVFKAYPNPAISDVNWEYEHRAAGETVISLYDFLGRKVRIEKQGGEPGGFQSGNFSLTGLEPGLYLMELQDNMGRLSQVVIVGR